jgi:hypothetical protein
MIRNKSTFFLLAAAGLGLTLMGCATIPYYEENPQEVVIIVPVPGSHHFPTPPVIVAPTAPLREEPLSPKTDIGATATTTRERPTDMSRGSQRAGDARGLPNENSVLGRSRLARK